jgi:hypothetical protein
LRATLHPPYLLYRQNRQTLTPSSAMLLFAF